MALFGRNASAADAPAAPTQGSNDIEEVVVTGIRASTEQSLEAKRNAGIPQFCDACFSGDYPIEPTDSGEFRRQLSLLSEVV